VPRKTSNGYRDSSRYDEWDKSVDLYLGNDFNGNFRGRYLWQTDEDIDTAGAFTRVFQLLGDPQAHGEGNRNWTIGTLPTILSAQQVWKDGEDYVQDYPEFETLRSSRAYWTLETWQPVVMSVCAPASDRTDNISYYRVNGSRSIFDNATESYDTLLKNSESRENFLSWIQMPWKPTSLLALFMHNDGPANGSGAGSSRDELLDKRQYTICTVASFWWETSTSLSLSPMAGLIQTDWPGGRKEIVHDQLRPIVINPEGITTLRTVEILDNKESPTTYIVPAFAAALSWIPGQNAHAIGDPLSFDMVEEKDLSSTKDPASYTSFRVDSIITGYGYGGTDTSTQLSLAVILTYCIITIVYVAYTIVTGHTTIAWNSATELIMLALQSKEPSDLGHISVGIDSMETLRRSVGIRVNTVNIGDTGEYREKLELVFEQDEGLKRRTLKKVERNRAC
jgi:hypothetical protein